MNKVHAIPIRNEVRGRRGSNHDIAIRLLHDIKAALEILVDEGRSSLIDLRQVPQMTPETYQFLRGELGTGEVSAKVTADLTVEISETAVAGVWWGAHRDGDGETVTEIIEITQVPSILRASQGEMRAAVVRLAAQMSVAEHDSRDAIRTAQHDGRNAAAEEVEG